MEHHSEKHEKHHHHILPTRTALMIGGTLLFLTFVTVWIAGVDLGPLNFVVAMAVATTKALLVALFFMNLYYDRKENSVIFGTSLLFLAIFFVLTSMDLFFRGKVVVNSQLMAAPQVRSTLKKPWISTPELVAKGKELFAIQCVSCHGVEGQGNGPAASALNPPPRNFHADQGWKNGRKAVLVFKTLKEGLAPSAMASYASLPSDDRWALSHYVISLGPTAALADTPEDFKKAGVNPDQEGGGAEKVDATIPLELALERVEVAPSEAELNAHLYAPQAAPAVERGAPQSRGAQIYAESCIQCHNAKAEGGIKILRGSVIVPALKAQGDGMKSQEAFNRWVIQGLPGNLMPGFGQYSSSDLRDLYRYVQGLSAGH
jgi:caa(3)-type oxidase subunit IV